jgi:hypothetical protein
MEALSRYLAGHHERAWSHVAALYDANPTPEIEAEVRAVAREIMQRVRRNAECLASNLEKVGYEIGGGTADVGERNAAPVGEPVAQAEIDRVAERRGPLPISLAVFWGTVGHLNFVGLPPLANVLDWPELEGIDAVQIYSPRDEPFVGNAIVLALDPTFKAGYGSVGPIYTLPARAADAALNFEDVALGGLSGNLPSSLVLYLRTAFARGGCFGLSEDTDRNLVGELRAGMVAF